MSYTVHLLFLTPDPSSKLPTLSPLQSQDPRSLLQTIQYIQGVCFVLVDGVQGGQPLSPTPWGPRLTSSVVAVVDVVHSTTLLGTVPVPSHGAHNRPSSAIGPAPVPIPLEPTADQHRHFHAPFLTPTLHPRASLCCPSSSMLTEVSFRGGWAGACTKLEQVPSNARARPYIDD